MTAHSEQTPTDPTDHAPEKSRERRSPVQGRARQKREDIVHTAALLVDEVGPDRVTTTLLARRLGISVGTVYSYFADRTLIFDEIVARAIEAHARRSAAVRSEPLGPGDFGSADAWLAGSNRIIDSLVHGYRTFPGFRALWFSHHLSPRMIETMRASDDDQAERLLLRLAQAGLRLDSTRPLDVVRTNIALIDMGLTLAFRNDHDGDEYFIAETKKLVHGFLRPYLAPLD